MILFHPLSQLLVAPGIPQLVDDILSVSLRCLLFRHVCLCVQISLPSLIWVYTMMISFLLDYIHFQIRSLSVVMSIRTSTFFGRWVNTIQPIK